MVGESTIAPESGSERGLRFSPDSQPSTPNPQPSTKSARQTFLAYRVELRLPTVDLAGARAITGLHENEIKDLCDTRVLPAWNIAVDLESRREWRILGRAARDWADHRPITADDDFITRLLYGPAKPYILGISFYAAWNCDSGHGINLINAGILKTLPGTSFDRGRGNTPCITWASAIAFLKNRRIT
jgi:hypothetical protein